MRRLALITILFVCLGVFSSCCKKPKTSTGNTDKLLDYFTNPIDLTESKDPIRTRIVRSSNEWNKRKYPDSHMPQFSTDENLVIPDDLAFSLAQDFPQYKFTIAKMGFMHWGPEKVNLIIITDSNTGDEVCHLWALWFGGDGDIDKFQQIMTQDRADSIETARRKLTTLASIIALAMNGKVGKVEITPKPAMNPSQLMDVNSFSIELFWGNSLWRIMNVDYYSSHTFGTISFINSSKPDPEVEKYLSPD